MVRALIIESGKLGALGGRVDQLCDAAVGTRSVHTTIEVERTMFYVMKHVQSMSSSVTPVRRYGNLASEYESYMLAVHSELPNLTQWNVPKPLGKPRPPDPIVMQSHSETVYPRPIH
ncbi:hypothetical protein Tco_1405041 [Tanacetum coccineum]